ncbi:FAD binding domain protein [Eremomyces bilateralis CBS 781.70]|uniref:FAD binding domain protein n=1 Tax=Eremomyces bilateralis CBS 781.70 TaxID=1392243 RepID=A0A6G1GFR9_9PEZI|nr:FAD binding domain protein [Eremomyces bilateralis CBS 781.70]KAF1816719.1 FAD binding domain protein [Eremomyces bilateralis CBS 781.70]
MKIIIVGAGPAGLAAYLHLKKHLRLSPDNSSHQLSIFESHRSNINVQTSSLAELNASTALVGGGLGVGPNGMRVVRKLDPQIHDRLENEGFVCDNFTFRSARGFVLATTPATDRKELPEHCVSIARHTVWECLKDAVGEDNISFRKVSGAYRNEAGKPCIKFADKGEDEQADLIIGADGVWSKVKDAALEGIEDKGQYDAVSEGLLGVGGFVEMPLPDHVLRDKTLCFTFGRNGFFGYGSHRPANQNQMMWWSTYQDDSLPDKKVIDRDRILEELRKRHQDWKDPVIHDIINKVQVDSVYPTWTLPELPTWGGNGFILIGDAAHALQSTSGQGVSQALEDSLTLALLLRGFLQKAASGSMTEEEAIDRTAKTLYQIRNPRVQKIAAFAAQSASGKRELTLVAEFMMCFFLGLIGKFPSVGKLLLGNYNNELYDWDAEKLVEEALSLQ